MKTFPLLQKLRTQPATILSTLSKCAMPIEIDRIVTSQQSTLQSTHFIQLIQMCNVNFLKFQTDITSNSILQKGQNLRYHPKCQPLGFFGFPQKRPVKHHVFLDLFGSGSGTLRVSKSQTCPAPFLLSRVFISGSRVFGNPVAYST